MQDSAQVGLYMKFEVIILNNRAKNAMKCMS